MKKRGLGLFSWVQDSHDNALSYTAGVVVGGIFLLGGLANGTGQVYEAAHGRPVDGNVILGAVACVAVGVFLSHAGVIYWWGKLISVFQGRHRPHSSQ